MRKTILIVFGSFVLLAILGSAAAIALMQMRNNVYHHSLQTVCKTNVKFMLVAVAGYRMHNRGHFPQEVNWYEKTAPYLDTKKRWYICLDDRKQSLANSSNYISYAFNSNLSGVDHSSIKDPRKTIVIFESERGYNAAGGPELLPLKPRHPDGDIYGFADGHVEIIPRDKLPGKEYWEK